MSNPLPAIEQAAPESAPVRPSTVKEKITGATSAMKDLADVAFAISEMPAGPEKSVARRELATILKPMKNATAAISLLVRR